MKLKKYIWILCMVSNGCVEEIPIDIELRSSTNIADILVVEATITDEFKNQEILLNRVNGFADDNILNVERGAEIRVSDQLGNNYGFIEQEPGIYVSEVPFAVQNEVAYQLFITTSNGVDYQSETGQVMGNSIIDDVYAERMASDNGVEGMAIFVDSSNPLGNQNNYRYTYEETYKIIAPNWTAFEFEVLQETLEFTEGGAPIYPNVQLVPREEEEQICFNTVRSNEIILSDGAMLDNSNIQGNLVRFINRNDPIISHRYSILVKQFLQSAEASKFYRTLLQFSQNENLFSEVQPGFLEGNITAVGTGEPMVIGFFNVASVTERRFFFNYEDFFPDEPLPPYFGTVNCNTLIAPILGNPERDGPIPPFVNCGTSLIELIKQEEVEFFLSNSNPPPECEGPYFVTQRECGDCTALGSNMVPEFWIDE